MKKGMTYCVKFNVSLSEASKYASNNIGALFLKKPKGTDAKLPIIDEPSVVHFNNDMKIMNARYNWTEVCGTFISTGGEKYIMLGNFLSDDETKYERMKKSKDVKVKELIAAYYYVMRFQFNCWIAIREKDVNVLLKKQGIRIQLQFIKRFFK